MKNQFNLNIKTPCSENFDQFSPTAKGGFCGSCQKEVIDFTQMNAEDIITFFKNKSTKNTCGRFKSNQLKPQIATRKKNKTLSFLTGIGLPCLSFLSFGTAEAQNTTKTTEPVKSDSEIEASKAEKNIVLKGTVYTEDDGLPLPGATIILKGTAIGAQTDFDGNFEFPEKLKKGDVLIISFVGFESQKVVIENKNSASQIELQIDLSMDACVIMGEVAVKKVYKSKKN